MSKCKLAVIAAAASVGSFALVESSRASVVVSFGVIPAGQTGSVAGLTFNNTSNVTSGSYDEVVFYISSWSTPDSTTSGSGGQSPGVYGLAGTFTPSAGAEIASGGSSYDLNNGAQSNASPSTNVGGVEPQSNIAYPNGYNTNTKTSKGSTAQYSGNYDYTFINMGNVASSLGSNVADPVTDSTTGDWKSLSGTWYSASTTATNLGPAGSGNASPVLANMWVTPGASISYSGVISDYANTTGLATSFSSAVPEPASLAILGVGAIAGLFARRSRKA